MATPLVSVVIPIHNAARYLGDALQSMVDQDLPHELLEAILVEDDCTDESPAIIAEFVRRHPWARTLRVDSPDGYSGQPRNIGMAAARGDYLCFFDADDLMTDGGLTRLVEVAESQDAEITTGGYSVFGVTEAEEPRLFSRILGSDPSPFTAAQIPMILAKPPSLAANLFRRDLVERAGICFSEGIVATDTVFWTQAALAARSIVYVNEVIYLYRLPWDRDDLTATVSGRHDEQYFLSLLNAYSRVFDSIRDDLDSGEDALSIVACVRIRYLEKRLRRPEVRLAQPARNRLLDRLDQLVAVLPEPGIRDCVSSVHALLCGS